MMCRPTFFTQYLISNSCYNWVLLNLLLSNEVLKTALKAQRSESFACKHKSTWLEGYCSLIRSKFVSKNCNFPSVLHLINTIKQVLEKELSLLSHFFFLAKVSSIWSKQSGHLTIVKMILKGKPWNVSL